MKAIHPAGAMTGAAILRVDRTADARQKITKTKPWQRSLPFNISKTDYVTRRFNASSASLIEFGSWTFAGTPLCAISRSKWSSELLKWDRTLRCGPWRWWFWFRPRAGFSQIQARTSL